MLNHWDALTLFLRQPGAPLDNNICERAMKKAILHLKNVLFYKTLNGARVGDIFMSLIHICSLNGVNSIEYFTVLQEHEAEMTLNPEKWLPWNYTAALLSPLNQNPQSAMSGCPAKNRTHHSARVFFLVYARLPKGHKECVLAKARQKR